MKFLKKDLEFLKTFQACIEDSEEKITIISNKETSKVFFVLFNDSIKLIEEKDQVVEEDYTLSIILSQFNSMLSLCREDDTIEISEGKIKFGNSSEYDFETFDFNMENFNDILNMSIEGEKVELKEISKIDSISFSMGTEKEIACIAYQDNHFISYNGSILSIIKTANTIENNFFLPSIFYKLYQLYKFDKVTLVNLDDNYFYMTLDNLKIYIFIPEYSIPYVFDENIKAKYDHPTGLTIKKEELKLALARIKVLNQKTTYNRVFVHVNESDIKLEIKDDYVGYENVTLSTIDESLKNFYFICNANYLYDILNNYSKDEFEIKLSNLDDLSVIKIQDVETDFILTLYKKYDE